MSSASGWGRARDRQAPRPLLPTGSLLVEGTPGLRVQSQDLVEVVTPNLSLGTGVGGGQGKKVGGGVIWAKGTVLEKAKRHRRAVHTACFPPSHTYGAKYR